MIQIMRLWQMSVSVVLAIEQILKDPPAGQMQIREINAPKYKKNKSVNLFKFANQVGAVSALPRFVRF